MNKKKYSKERSKYIEDFDVEKSEAFLEKEGRVKKTEFREEMKQKKNKRDRKRNMKERSNNKS